MERCERERVMEEERASELFLRERDGREGSKRHPVDFPRLRDGWEQEELQHGTLTFGSYIGTVPKMRSWGALQKDACSRLELVDLPWKHCAELLWP